VSTITDVGEQIVRSASEAAGECYDLVFVGGGISCAYTLRHYVALLEKQAPFTPEKVAVFERTGEFWTGIPYGARSGRFSLLISSLREFLPQSEEREAFSAWLTQNSDWVFDAFRKGDEELARKWLRLSEGAISRGQWDELFIPRYTFGLYLQERMHKVLSDSANKGLLRYRLIAADVLDIERQPNHFSVSFQDAASNQAVTHARKVILGIGSLQKSSLHESSARNGAAAVGLVNDMYDPSFERNIQRITSCLNQPQRQGHEVLIVGSNASALEVLFWLNNTRELSGLIRKFTILSPNPVFPHRISEGANSNHSPKHLMELVRVGALRAHEILEAIKMDVAEAAEQNLNIADLFGSISRGMGEALNQLTLAEQKKFVARYGVEIGRLQRRAGAEYLDVVDDLVAQGRLEMLAGRFVSLHASEPGQHTCEYLSGRSGEGKAVAGPFSAIINCARCEDLTNSSSTLVHNLIEKRVCVPNDSDRGFLVSEEFEASENCYVMGPLTAGNLAGKIRVWHAESCTRIIGMSRQLAAVLIRDDPNGMQATFRGTMQVLGTVDADRWMAVLAKATRYDFYHLPQYHEMAERRDEGNACLFAYSEGGYSIALPLLLRPVDSLAPNHWNDATSVYGYSGPVASHLRMPESVVNNFQTALRKALVERRVVSAFSRLHPLIAQQDFLSGLGVYLDHGQTVSIDLTAPIHEQRARYAASCRTRINKLLRAGISCTREPDLLDLPKFVDMYHETMRRVNAHPSYFFNYQYFEELAANLGSSLQLFCARLEGEVISGGLFTLCQGIVQYHLGATRDAFLRLSPMALIFDTARQWGHDAGATVLHLGGGVGGKKDSLFDFKSRFSNRRHCFDTWRWVICPAVYRELCEEHSRTSELNGLDAASGDYFPEYRGAPLPRAVGEGVDGECKLRIVS
jgi:uncharacterized NAD(P)/FAD-binding protein YdhS